MTSKTRMFDEEDVLGLRELAKQHGDEGDNYEITGRVALWLTSLADRVEAEAAREAELVEAIECLFIGIQACAIPHDGERAVLREAVDMAQALLAVCQGRTP